MFHDYLQIESNGQVSIKPHSLLTFLEGGLPSSLHIHENSDLWESIRNLYLERISIFLFNIITSIDAKHLVEDYVEKCEKSLQSSNNKASPVRSLNSVVRIVGSIPMKEGKNLENALHFREACDNHLNVIHVLQRINEVCSLGDCDK